MHVRAYNAVSKTKLNAKAGQSLVEASRIVAPAGTSSLGSSAGAYQKDHFPKAELQKYPDR